MQFSCKVDTRGHDRHSWDPQPATVFLDWSRQDSLTPENHSTRADVTAHRGFQSAFLRLNKALTHRHRVAAAAPLQVVRAETCAPYHRMLRRASRE